MNKNSILLALFFFVNSFLFSQYTKKDCYIGINLGTNGLGGQFGYAIHPRLNVRINSSYLQADFKDELIEKKGLIEKEDELLNKWNIDVSSFLIGTVIDFKPFTNVEFLRISAGVFYNSFSANYNSSYSYSDMNKGLNFDAGKLQLNVTTTPIKPYIGVLIGVPSNNKRINFLAEIGTMFQQSPTARFTGSGMIGPTVSQEPLVQKNISNYNFHPSVSFQLNYRFKGSNSTETKKEQINN